MGKIVALDEKAVHPVRYCTAVQFGKRVKALRESDMNDERRSSGPEQPSAETELSADQHRAEKLAFENQMLRAVLDSMPDNISIKDLEGRYIFDNSSHRLFLGATNPGDVVGKTLFDFLPPIIAAKFHAEDLRVLRSGEAVVQSVTESIVPTF